MSGRSHVTRVTPNRVIEAQQRARELMAYSQELRSRLDSTLLEMRAAPSSSRLAHLKSEVQQLREAMDSRAVIEQAKGMIMATMRCSADEAFALLVGQSQHENRKLRVVAEEIVRLKSQKQAHPHPHGQLRTPHRSTN